MKSPYLAPIACLAALACGLAFGQGEDPPTAEERIADLEQELEVVREVADAQAAELARQGAVQDGIVRYLQGQAKALEELRGTLAASEKEGFTYGINPESREILLAGWRERIEAAQKGLPNTAGAPSVAPGEEAPGN